MPCGCKKRNQVPPQPAQQPAKIVLKESESLPKVPQSIQTPEQQTDKIVEKLNTILTPPIGI